jgi:hypothetical protein
MKAKEKVQKRTAVPFDPVLFAATAPSRKPTEADIEAARERPDDAIEPKEHPTMEGIVEDL